MKKIVLKGRIFSGHGGGARYLKLPWVKKQITEKLGFEPFLGTLNLKLSKETVERKKQLLRSSVAIKIIPEEGFCLGLCFKTLIMNKIQGAIVLPQVPGYPEDVLEVIAPVSLRKTLGVTEGDEVQLTVYLPR
ncbi:MAG: DUF120 domain-containing protein [Candidatus Bathyarchaeia archaeon]|nr:CTP-dependent riboflavin kinase [Candidatus Bathyarchaeota archaeon A05DMB-4]MDH7595395.1 CTP-dependent riboflavin kinase [Candidatus Bathyarchaeota archaeon]